MFNKACGKSQTKIKEHPKYLWYVACYNRSMLSIYIWSIPEIGYYKFITLKRDRVFTSVSGEMRDERILCIAFWMFVYVTFAWNKMFRIRFKCYTYMYTAAYFKQSQRRKIWKWELDLYESMVHSNICHQIVGSFLETVYRILIYSSIHRRR